MLKTPDEIKKGLECCATVKVGGVCPFDCPLQPLCASGDDGAAQREILALIQQLQAETTEKDARIRLLCADIEEAKKKLDCWQDKLDVKIDKVEAGIVKIIQDCMQLQAERDAEVADIKEMVHDPYEPCFCDYCKLTEEECSQANCRGRNAFEWRGVQKKN